MDTDRNVNPAQYIITQSVLKVKLKFMDFLFKITINITHRN